MKPQCMTIQMKAIEQYFHVVLMFIMLYKVVLIFKSVAETLPGSQASILHLGHLFRVTWSGMKSVA